MILEDISIIIHKLYVNNNNNNNNSNTKQRCNNKIINTANDDDNTELFETLFVDLHHLRLGHNFPSVLAEANKVKEYTLEFNVPSAWYTTSTETT